MNLIDHDHNFWGRQNTLDVLRKRMSGLKEGYRQNIALLGSRYIGKTSILQKLIAEHDDRDIFILYLDLESRDFIHFARQFTKSLLYYYLKSEGQPVQEDLALLCAFCKGTIPQTVAVVETIREQLSAGKITETYAALLSLPDTFCAESKKAVVLIFDEFHNLDNFAINRAVERLQQI